MKQYLPFEGPQHRFTRRVAALACITVLASVGCQRAPQAVDGATGIGDPVNTLLGNGGYDVQHYTIALDVTPETNAVQGTTTIQAQVSQHLHSLSLDFQGLTVDVVTINAAQATFSHEGHELTIVPSRPLPPDRPLTITVSYHGSPQPIPSFVGHLLVGWFHAEDGSINVISEPDGGCTWFPANDHPRDKATYRFEITVPKPWTVAATGVLSQAFDLGERTQYIWEMDQPMASYLAAIEIDRYVLESGPGPDGVAIRNYYPVDFSPSKETGVAALSDMISYFSGLFGPYPFDEYGVVIADPGITACQAVGALETQSLSVHCPTATTATVVAHELAHQWFGDSVSLEHWQDIWLKEGAATYAEWLWLMRGKDLSKLTSFVRIYRRAFLPTVPIGQPPAGQLYGKETYIGGALVYHALRLRVGEDAFWQIVRTFLSRYRYGNASRDDLIATAEEVSGQELGPFFDEWLLSTDIPFSVEPSQ